MLGCLIADRIEKRCRGNRDDTHRHTIIVRCHFDRFPGFPLSPFDQNLLPLIVNQDVRTEQVTTLAAREESQLLFAGQVKQDQAVDILAIYLAIHGQQQAVFTLRCKLDDRVVSDRCHNARVAIAQVELGQVVAGREIQAARDLGTIFSTADYQDDECNQGYSRDY